MNYFIKFIFIISFFLATTVKAQNKDLYNVKLKTGLIIKCELLRVVTDSIVVIRQFGQVNTIKYSEIESIQFSETLKTAVKPAQVQVVTSPEQPMQTTKDAPSIPRKNLPDSRLSMGLQTGLCFGQTSDFPTVSVLLRLSVIKGITKRIQAGGVLGIDPYLQYDGLVIGSVMGELDYYFMKEKPQSPFIHTQCGYGFNLNSNYIGRDGGLSYVVGFGQSFRDQSQNVVSLMLGYRLQRTKEEIIITGPVNNFTRTYNREFNRIEFKVEFRFF